MTPPAEHPYASFVHLVQKPARYLGGEFGARRKDWGAVEARVCLAFPDVYDIGMSHLGFKILYKILNDDPRTLAERAYAPWVDMEARAPRARPAARVARERAPALATSTSSASRCSSSSRTRTSSRCSTSAASRSAASDRGEGDPLVIAGGPTATHPEPLAPFLDAVVIGDGEERTTEVALVWTRAKQRGVPRAERLRALAKLRGVYVPSLYATRGRRRHRLHGRRRAPRRRRAAARSQRTLVDDLNRFPFPDDGPIGGPEAIFDRMSIEIARGCTEGCRFCQAG